MGCLHQNPPLKAQRSMWEKAKQKKGTRTRGGDDEYKVTVPAGHRGPIHARTRRNCGTTHRTLQKLTSDGVPALRR